MYFTNQNSAINNNSNDINRMEIQEEHVNNLGPPPNYNNLPNPDANLHLD